MTWLLLILLVIEVLQQRGSFCSCYRFPDIKPWLYRNLKVADDAFVSHIFFWCPPLIQVSSVYHISLLFVIRWNTEAVLQVFVIAVMFNVVFIIPFHSDVQPDDSSRQPVVSSGSSSSSSLSVRYIVDKS